MAEIIITFVEAKTRRQVFSRDWCYAAKDHMGSTRKLPVQVSDHLKFERDNVRRTEL